MTLTRDIILPDGFVIHAKVAMTEAEKQHGLRNVYDLAPNCGMLFAYDQMRLRPFSMAGCLIGIDMIFMNAGHQVVEIVTGMPNVKEPWNVRDTCGGNLASRYILEVNAGVAAAHQVRLGSVLRF